MVLRWTKEGKWIFWKVKKSIGKKRWQGMERRKERGNQEQKGGGDKFKMELKVYPSSSKQS